MTKYKVLITFIVLLLLLIPASQLAAQEPVNLVKNGGFEEGFYVEPGIAEVGNEWGYFHSGNVDPGWYDDTWELVVPEGDHAQLIELIDSGELDTYAGIYQTVDVTPGQAYKFSMHGLVRSTEGSIDVSNYGYRLLYALDQSGSDDWQQVGEWTELMWDEQPRTAPANGVNYNFEYVEETFTASGEEVTIFIRAWKKWMDDGKEGNYDIDNVMLVAVDAEEVPAPAEPAPLPETGDGPSGASLNIPILLLSLALIALLIGGAVYNQKRRNSQEA